MRRLVLAAALSALMTGAALAQAADPAPVDAETLPGNDSITVPGQVERPVVAPAGDPRPMSARPGPRAILRARRYREPLETGSYSWADSLRRRSVAWPPRVGILSPTFWHGVPPLPPHLEPHP